MRLILASLLASVATASPIDGAIITNAPQQSTFHSTSLPNSKKASETPSRRRLSVTASEKDALVQKHNDLRAAVSIPCTAANMEQLTWDNTLAAASQSYAEQCIWAHDTANNQANGWGENLAMSWSSSGNEYDLDTLRGYVDAWYSEIDDTKWNLGATSVSSVVYSDPETQCKSYAGDGTCMIGHYTQVVWASSNKIGCGVAECPDGTLTGSGGINLVCKYTPAGNMATSGGLEPPFEVGASCAACPGTCVDGLCQAGTAAVCEDTISTMNFNGVDYTTCESLIAGTAAFGADYWCTEQEPGLPICQLTCGACQTTPGVGTCEGGDPDNNSSGALSFSLFLIALPVALFAAF